MSDHFMPMGPGRAFVEGHVLEPVDRDGGCLVSCNDNRIQFQFDHRPMLLSGQLIQAYGPFEPETTEEYALLTVEKFGAFPLGWRNGTK